MAGFLLHRSYRPFAANDVEKARVRFDMELIAVVVLVLLSIGVGLVGSRAMLWVLFFLITPRVGPQNVESIAASKDGLDENGRVRLTPAA